MKRLLFLAAFLLSAGTADAGLRATSSTASTVAPGTDVSNANATATGGSASRTLADRFAEVVNVKDYGAKCDGTTDDTTSIAAAITAAKAKWSAVSSNSVVLRFPSGSKCLVTSTLNLTGITGDESPRFIVEGNGTDIFGQIAAGSPVVDALGSSKIVWKSVRIVGDAAANYVGGPAKIGLLTGALSTSDVGGSWMLFDDLNVRGDFSLASCYNLSGEQSTWRNASCINSNSGSSVYAFVQDGFNHFNITSAFVTETIPVDTPRSFNGDLVEGSKFWITNGTGTPVWIGGTRGHNWFSNYAFTSSGTVCAKLSQATGSNGFNRNLRLDLHCEGASLATELLLTGPFATPTLTRMDFSDAVLQATTNLFALDTGVTSANLQSLRISIPTVTNVGVTAFDTPANYTVNGEVYFNNAASWVQPANFSGRTNLNGAETIVSALGSAASAAIQPIGKATTGIYFTNANQIDFIGNAVHAININGSGLVSILAGESVAGLTTINANNNAATSINTGTSTSNVNIGGGNNQVIFGSVVILKNYTVATLPSCSSNTYGFAAVSDATAPTYNGALTGGGAVKVPVFCDGTSWTSH